MDDPYKTHLGDQLGASFRVEARILGEYRAELIEQGFDEEQVWELVKRLQARIEDGKK